MFNSGFGNNGDFEAMARQYWSAWGAAMRQGSVGGMGGMGGMGGPAVQPANQWQQAVDWWSQLMPEGRSQANDAVGRFNQQASQWFGQMQQVAAQFAGQDSNPSDISQAWRRAIGAQGDNPFPEMFKAMRGQGAHGLDSWLEQVKPFLDGLQQQGKRWQQMPAFGQYREHQERWQDLQQAQQDYQVQTEAFNVLMQECATRAFDTFEHKLMAHDGPGRQITSARGLFDLWIDSAEEAYATVALSSEFREVYGALGNAQMRLRGAIQREVEHMTGLFGIPTRIEVDSAHRKIAELERALRRAAAAGSPLVAARKAAGTREAEAPVQVAPSTTKPRRAARKPAVAPSKPARKAAARRSPVARKKPAKKAARKVAAKPAVVTQKVPVRKAAAPAKARSPVATATARSAAVRKTSRKRAAAGQPVAKVAAQKKVASARGDSRVVSMKDWVAHNAAPDTPDTAVAKSTGRKGARK